MLVTAELQEEKEEEKGKKTKKQHLHFSLFNNGCIWVKTQLPVFPSYSVQPHVALTVCNQVCAGVH